MLGLYFSKIRQPFFVFFFLVLWILYSNIRTLILQKDISVVFCWCDLWALRWSILLQEICGLQCIVMIIMGAICTNILSLGFLWEHILYRQNMRGRILCKLARYLYMAYRENTVCIYTVRETVQFPWESPLYLSDFELYSCFWVWIGIFCPFIVSHLVPWILDVGGIVHARFLQQFGKSNICISSEVTKTSLPTVSN